MLEGARVNKNGTLADIRQIAEEVGGKVEEGRMFNGSVEGKGNNKRRRRRKHKGRRRDRNREGRPKKEKHDRRKGGGCNLISY